jgi:hypothetical protein
MGGVTAGDQLIRLNFPLGWRQVPHFSLAGLPTVVSPQVGQT